MSNLIWIGFCLISMGVGFCLGAVTILRWLSEDEEQSEERGRK